MIVRSVALDDRFIEAIMKIYNETKVRQGKPFWHYGKDFETIKKETITFPERSEFFGAYLDSELIGFIKLVFCGDVAALMAIVSLNSRHDCRPNNALLAKAVEICASKGMSYLVYGKYVYGNNMNSALTEFKRRNGFEALRFPRYYVPLTWKGRLVLLLKLHRGWVGIFPPRMLALFVGVRAKVFQSLGALRRVRAEEAVDAKSE